MTTVPALACTFAPSRDLPAHARIAEELGYERLWVYDSPALYGDVWIALARVAEATSQIGMAAGVAIPFLRHPMVTASAIATVAELAPGRLAVAFGTGYTGARTLGRAPMRWSDLARYLEQVRGLLAGDVVEIDGRRTRMINSPGFGPSRPLDVPLFAAPRGPKGLEVARRLANGVIVTEPTGDGEWETQALLCSGTVLDPGEDASSPRVAEAAGVGYATALHGLWEMAPQTLSEVPGGAAWLSALESEVPEADRHWAVHEGHLVAITARDRPAVAQAGASLFGRSWSGEAAAIRRRAAEAAANGITELVYGPTGPDIPRELAAFAAAVGTQ